MNPDEEVAVLPEDTQGEDATPLARPAPSNDARSIEQLAADTYGPAQPQADERPLLERGLDTAMAAHHGFFEAVPFASHWLRDFDELNTQLTDSPEAANAYNQATQENQGAAWAGYLGGGVGQAALGYQAPTLGMMAAEGAAYGALEGGIGSIGEDLIENPGISAELMASHALHESFVRGGTGAVLGFAGGVLGRGLERVAGAAAGGVRRFAGRADDLTDDTVESVLRGIGNEASDVNQAARGVDASPMGPLGRAVRQAEAEGIDNFTTRVNREAAQGVNAAVSELRSAMPPRAIWERVSRSVDPAQEAGLQRVWESAKAAREIGGALDPTNAADSQILAAARQYQFVQNMGHGTSRMNSLAEGTQLLQQSIPNASPEFRMIAENLMDETRTVLRDEQLWGTSATAYKRFGDALDNIEMAARESGGQMTPDIMAKLSDNADVLESIARLQPEAPPRSQGRRPQAPNASVLRSAQNIRDGIDRVNLSGRVAAVHAELQSATRSGKFEQKLGRWASRGVGGLVGGFPGAMIGDAAYSLIKDRGVARRVIWAAQNAYERYTGRASDSLLKFVQQPRPAVNRFKFSAEDYRSAVDNVRASAGNPSPRARSVKTEFAGDFSAVPPRTADIPVARDAATRAREELMFGRTMPPDTGSQDVLTPPPRRTSQSDDDATMPPSNRN